MSDPAVPVGVPGEVVRLDANESHSTTSGLVGVQPAQRTDGLQVDAPPGNAYRGRPVGVQPEPAEEAHEGMHTFYDEPVTHQGSRADCAICEARFADPAVPVVHPEPGEGAHERAFAAARAVLTVEGYGRIGPQVLDAIVAAAVAAVRADLEEALALHTGLHQCLGGSWYADNDPTYRGTVATHGPCPTAALIRGRS